MSLEKNTLANVNDEWAITYQGLSHRSLSLHVPVDMIASYKSKLDADMELSHPDYNTDSFRAAIDQAYDHFNLDDDDAVTQALRDLNDHHIEIDQRREEELRQQIQSLEREGAEAEDNESERVEQKTPDDTKSAEEAPQGTAAEDPEELEFDRTDEDIETTVDDEGVIIEDEDYESDAEVDVVPEAEVEANEEREEREEEKKLTSVIPGLDEDEDGDVDSEDEEIDVYSEDK